MVLVRGARLQRVRKRKRASQTRISSEQILDSRNAERDECGR